jgi:hypothetical protein
MRPIPWKSSRSQAGGCGGPGAGWRVNWIEESALSARCAAASFSAAAAAS